jgi:hypothetical protein
MEHFELPKKGLTSFKAAMFGLAGASFASLLKVLDMQPQDTALAVAGYSFAAAIPLLIALAVSSDIMEDTRYARMSFTGFALTMLLNAGNWAFVVGLSALLWHYSIPLALTFAGCALTALVAFIAFQVDLDKSNPPS